MLDAAFPGQWGLWGLEAKRHHKGVITRESGRRLGHTWTPCGPCGPWCYRLATHWGVIWNGMPVHGNGPARSISGPQVFNAVQAETTGERMESEPHIAFGPFRLGLETPKALLWRGEQALTLRARSLRRHRHPPACLRQWGSGDRQDDGARPLAGTLCDGTRGANGAGPVSRARGGGRAVPPLVRC